MGAFATDLELMELALRTLCDIEPPEPTDAVLLFGQTTDNELSVLQATAELFTAGKVRMVALAQGGKILTGEPYRLDWHKKLYRLGVPEGALVFPAITSELAHTHTEAIALISHAREKGWETAYVTSLPLHQVRAFVNTVSIVLRDYPELKVFSRVGKTQPWTQKVIHSQKIETGKRSELIEREWSRILKYYEKGDLVSARQVLDYLDHRDG